LSDMLETETGAHILPLQPAFNPKAVPTLARHQTWSGDASSDLH